MGIHPSTSAAVISRIDRALQGASFAARVDALMDSAAEGLNSGEQWREETGISRYDLSLMHRWRIARYGERVDPFRYGPFEPCEYPGCTCRSLFDQEVFNRRHEANQLLTSQIAQEREARLAAEAEELLRLAVERNEPPLITSWRQEMGDL